MSTKSPEHWTEAWPDALAFAVGLAIAWWARWDTADLIWSLWLSSLVVGYATIVWIICRPGVQLVLGLRREPERVTASPVKSIAGLGVLLGGGLFMLAFFTFHFGMFHFVHSAFLSGFFPITETQGQPDATLYLEVLHRYWIFLPVAFVAERAGFRFKEKKERPDTSVTVEAIARRKARGADSDMMAPYKNVIRMHLLIFFFAFAHAMKLENFAIYAVVYAVYFFPWRLVFRHKRAEAESV